MIYLYPASLTHPQVVKANTFNNLEERYAATPYTPDVYHRKCLTEVTASQFFLLYF